MLSRHGEFLSHAISQVGGGFMSRHDHMSEQSDLMHFIVNSIDLMSLRDDCMVSVSSGHMLHLHERFVSHPANFMSSYGFMGTSSSRHGEFLSHVISWGLHAGFSPFCEGSHLPSPACHTVKRRAPSGIQRTAAPSRRILVPDPNKSEFIWILWIPYENALG